MQEAVVAFIVLVIGVVIGSLLTPTEPMLRPLFPDEIKGPGAAHDEPAHGHHH
jgi:hypothetical protein